ncbi:MAG: hypothetical protein U1F52_09310 [Burkholderiales bacterium]
MPGGADGHRPPAVERARDAAIPEPEDDVEDDAIASVSVIPLLAAPMIFPIGHCADPRDPDTGFPDASAASAR